MTCSIYYNNTLIKEKKNQYFDDDIFKGLYLMGNLRILIFQISLNFVPRCPIDNKSALINSLWPRNVYGYRDQGQHWLR